MAPKSSGEGTEAEAADKPATCEVCGTDAAARLMVLCKYYGSNHQVGRHTFCGPVPCVRGKRDEDFECLACKQYCHRLGAAVQARRDAALRRQGRLASQEEMPALKPLRGVAPRVRHGFEVALQPTEQQKIDRAAAAAAGDEDFQTPNKRRKIDHKPPAAAAAAQAGLSSRRQTAATAAAAAAGLNKRGGGPAAGAAAHRATRKHPAANKGFVAAINRGHDAGVRAAQAGVQTAKAAAHNMGVDGQPGMQEGGPNPVQPARRAIRHPLARHHRGLGLTVQPAEFEEQLVKAKLQCRLVVLDSEPAEHHPADDVDVDSYVHMLGTFWRSEEQEQQAAPDQQAAHQQLLADMRQEQGGQAAVFLMGGAFNLAAHPSVQSFLDDPELNYQPLLFIPDYASGKAMVLELLGAPRRFAVMSIGSKLLVLVPSCTGELVAVCPRQLEDADALTADVVKTIMQHPKLGCPSRDCNDDAPPQSASESLLGPPPAEPGLVDRDTKEGILTQQQQQQQQDEGEQDEEQQAAEGHGGDDEPVDEGQQQQQDWQLEDEPHMEQQAPALDHQHSAASAEASACNGLAQQQDAQQQQPQQQQQQQPGRLPVEQLPVGMRVSAQQRQQQQQQQELLHGSPAQGQQASAAAGAPKAAAQPGSRLPEAAAGAADPVLVAGAAAVPGPGGAAGTLGHVGGSSVLPVVPTVSTSEAVEGAALAQLIKKLGLDTAGHSSQQQKQRQRQPLTLRCCMPQVSDLSDIQHLRLFLVGFPPEWLDEGSSLWGPIAAARKLVDGVYTSHRALEELLLDLGLQHSTHSRPSSPSSVLDAQHYCLAPASPPMAATATAANGGGAQGSVDLTEGPQDSCYRVLLVPEHLDSQQLQQLLGPVPLWQLLASPVAIFRQGPGHGLLHHLQLTSRRQQQDAGSSGRGCARRRLPASLSRQQLYSDGFALVADQSTLAHSSSTDLEQLLQLLKQAQQQLQAAEMEAGGVVGGGASGWQLLLSRQELQALPVDKQRLIEEGLSHHIVLLLEQCLAPGSLAATRADEPTTIIHTALALASQHERSLRHVAVITHDVGRTQQQQQQSPALSGAAAGEGPGQQRRSKGSKGSQQGDAGGSRGGSRLQPGAEQADMPRLLKAHACLLLSAGAAQPRLLTGTLSQVLQLLTGLVGSACNGDAAAPASP